MINGNISEHSFLHILLKKGSILLFIFIGAVFYCASMTWSALVGQNLATIFFVFLLCFLIYLNIKKIDHNDSSPLFIITQLALFNLIIAITAQILHTPNEFFWVDDSIKTHLPEALKFKEYLSGHAAPQGMGIYSGLGTHFFTAISFMIFGVNTFASTFAQLFFKIIAVYSIYGIGNFLWNKRIGLLAMVLYGFCPTIFFYNLLLYKDTAVQAFYAAVIYCSLKFFIEKKIIYALPLTILLYALLRERFYISYLMVITFFCLAIRWPLKKNFVWNAILTLILTAGALYVYNKQSIRIMNLPQILVEYRNAHTQYSDVQTQYNYNIPYPVAFVKILFSPYFSPNKFKLLRDFSTLIIWGSFINQIIILCGVLGFFKCVRKKLIHIYLWIPFILFLGFTAYISPWSGRLRDTYYPLIACYAAYLIFENKLISKLLKLNKDKNYDYNNIKN